MKTISHAPVKPRTKGSRGRLLALAAATALVLVLTLTPAVLLGQVNDELTAGIEFNFTTPGARSLGLGGAFIGLADDATAAFTNPAGLTILTRQEVSIEVRNTGFSSLFTDRGHFQGPASGIGVDTIDGLRFGETDDDTTGLSFLSYVYPAGNFRLAVYRHELANFETGLLSQGAFLTLPPGCSTAVLNGCARTFPVQAAMELDIQNFGVSAAYRFADKVSLGLGLSYYDSSLEGLTQRYDLDFPADLTSVGAFFGPPDFSPSNVFVVQSHDGDDQDVGLNIGLLVDLTQRLTLGAVYRQGPDLEFTYTVLCGPSNPALCQSIPTLDDGVESARGELRIPDVYGLGLAIRPTDTLTITLDYDRVEHTSLGESFLVLPPDSSTDPRDFQVDDADEFHLGIEYILVGPKYPVALRIGGFRDPAHQITFAGENPFTQLLWAAGAAADDETHITGGIGVNFGEKLSLDAAVDISDRADIGSLSAVFRF